MLIPFGLGECVNFRTDVSEVTSEAAMNPNSGRVFAVFRLKLYRSLRPLTLVNGFGVTRP